MANHPCLFIGLGGAGSTTVAHLKRILLKSVGADVLHQYYRFLFFDTNNDEFTNVKRIFHQEFKVDPDFIKLEQEWFPIGNFNPYVYAKDVLAGKGAREIDIQKWLDSKSADTFPNKLADDGAGGDRQRGRLCFAINYDRLNTAIRTMTQDLNTMRQNLNVSEPVHYWIVTSSCGGTGSSCFYDVLYLISIIYQQIGGAEPITRPIIYSPNPYIDAVTARNEKELINRYPANAYAFFLELQTAINNYHKGKGKAAVQDFALPSQVSQGFADTDWRPFESAVIMDTACEDAMTFIPFEELYSITAEMIAYNILTGADKKLNSWWMNPVPVKDPDTDTWGYWNTSGFRAVEYPTKPLREYCAASYFSDVAHSYLEPKSGITESILKERAENLLWESILSKLGPARISKDQSKTKNINVNAFREVCRKYLNEHIESFGSIDDFCMVDSNRPDEQIVNPGAVTNESLEAAIRELSKKIEDMKSNVRKDFKINFGDPKDLNMATFYSELCRTLWMHIEEYIEKEGICSVIGTTANPQSGLISKLISLIMNRQTAVKEALDASNQRVDELKNGKIGLNTLKATIAKEAEKLGGILQKWRGPSKAFMANLNLFAQKRRELLEESYANIFLMLEIELLTYVGSLDIPVRPVEWFNYRVNEASILLHIQEQVIRIRSWLGLAESDALKSLQKVQSDLQTLMHSKITRYMPSIDNIESSGKRKPLANHAMTVLGNLDRSISHRLKTFTAKVGEKKEVTWSSLCPHVGDESPGARQLFKEGVHQWVERQFESDQTLNIQINMKLADYVMNAPERVMEIKDMLSPNNVLTFSKVSDSVRHNASKYRLIVTSTGPNDNFTKSLSMGTNDAHLQDPTADWRAVVVKYYTKLCLEKAFPMIKALRATYEQFPDYEPHIRKQGRTYYTDENIKILEHAFSFGIVWSWILRKDNWNAADNLRRLFTKRLQYQPKAYLSTGPIKVDDGIYSMLGMDLSADMFNADGELECPIQGAVYTKTGSISDTWSSVLRNLKFRQNLMLFHRQMGGIDLSSTSDNGDIIIKVTDTERAQVFLEWLQKYKPVLQQRIAPLLARPQTGNNALQNIYGLVMYNIESAESKIAARIAGGTDHPESEI